MYRKLKTFLALALITTTVLLSGCYLFDLSGEWDKVKVSLEPRIMELREGEDAVFSVVVEPKDMEDRVDVEFTMENESLGQVFGITNKAILTAEVRGITRVYAREKHSGKTADALVNIRAPDGGTDIYLTTPKKIITANKGQNIMLSAKLQGGTVSEQDQIAWTINNPSLGTIIGAGGTALFQCSGEGNGIITISHTKAPSTVQIQVVSSQDNVGLYLSRNSIAAVKGANYSIEANFTTRPSGMLLDETDISWTLVVPAGEEPIGYLIGSFGAETRFYATKTGTQKVLAEYTNGAKAFCEVVVQEGEGIELEATAAKMEPGMVRDFKYWVTPSGANVTIVNQNPDIATFQKTTDEDGEPIIRVTAMDTGATTATIKTGLSTQEIMSVTVAWTNRIAVSTNTFQSSIGDMDFKEIDYEIFPPTAAITAITTNRPDVIQNIFHDPATKKIRFKAYNEGSGSLTLTGNNGVTKNIAVIVNGVGIVTWQRNLTSKGIIIGPSHPDYNAYKARVGSSYNTNDIMLLCLAGGTTTLSLQAVPTGIICNHTMGWTRLNNDCSWVPLFASRKYGYSVSVAGDQKSFSVSYPSLRTSSSLMMPGKITWTAEHPMSGTSEAITCWVFVERGNVTSTDTGGGGRDRPER